MPKSPQSLPVGKLLDLLLLGLMFLRDKRPNKKSWPGASVFHAFRHAGVITEDQRRALVTNASLFTCMMDHGEILRGQRLWRDIKPRVEETDKWLVILVARNEQFLYHRLVGVHGYLLVITKSGLAQAQSIALQYSQLIDASKFALGWDAYGIQMRGIRGAESMLSQTPRR